LSTTEPSKRRNLIPSPVNLFARDAASILIPGAVAPEQLVAKPASRKEKPARAGRVLVGGHFAPEVQTALKVIAAEERTTLQALLAEGINTVFAKRRKPEIAEI
jgi:hypothetical protein